MTTTLLTLRDQFTEEEYPKNEQGFSDVPPTDILAWLADKFPGGYSWHVTAQGFTPSGYAYVTIKLNVIDGDFSHSCPGSAENASDAPVQMGFAGLQLLALRNAVLRNLGAGHSLYQRDPIHREPKQNSTKSYNYNNGNSGYQGRNNDTEWTGQERVNIGKYRGTNTTWAEVEDGYLKYVTKGDKPNRNALKEIERRRKTQNTQTNSNSRSQKVLEENPFD